MLELFVILLEQLIKKVHILVLLGTIVRQGLVRFQGLTILVLQGITVCQGLKTIMTLYQTCALLADIVLMLLLLITLRTVQILVIVTLAPFARATFIVLKAVQI